MHSMTAFAAHEVDTALGKLSCEIKSVNQRFLDLSFKYPEFLRSSEHAFRKVLNQKLARGKVAVFIRFFPSPDTSLSELSINQSLVQQLTACGEQISALTSLKNDVSVRSLLSWPDVVLQKPTDTSSLNDAAHALLESTVDKLMNARLREGQAMQQVLSDKSDTINQLVAQIRAHVPTINQHLHDKLNNRIADLNIEHNPERLEQELAIQLQKVDITEELDRLDAHMDEFSRVLSLSEPVGRRLDFLVQELNRESNTIGSKSISNVTSNASIELKVTIEQMREQIQNIE